MRLVCPNCEAKYEVPDDAIPDTGRDVQCANCGHAWFQMRQKPVAAEPKPAEHKPAELKSGKAKKASAVPVAEVAPEMVAEPIMEAAPEAIAEPVAEATAEAAVPEVAPADAERVVEAETEAEAEAEAPPMVEASVAAVVSDPALVKVPAGYAVDDSVLAILREEADREALARKADTLSLESQPDLGIDAALSPTQNRAAMLKSEEAAAGKPSARRDLLPDVEEINSTLRPSEQPAEEEPVAEVPAVVDERRGGFRSGFLAVMTLSILATAVYLSAPQLRSAVPALAEPLDAYVGFVDSMRLQLDGLMKSATVAINGEAG